MGASHAHCGQCTALPCSSTSRTVTYVGVLQCGYYVGWYKSKCLLWVWVCCSDADGEPANGQVDMYGEANCGGVGVYCMDLPRFTSLVAVNLIHDVCLIQQHNHDPRS